jgi:predicted AAA+ superfamily ATPase
MFTRSLKPKILDGLGLNPAVAILGPRQAGKTTLAMDIGKQMPYLYLDMENPQDRQRLHEWFNIATDDLLMARTIGSKRSSAFLNANHPLSGTRGDVTPIPTLP